MLIVENQEHFDKVREFARSVGAEPELQKQLGFLAGFGGGAAKVRCHLYSDFAPHSFFWRRDTARLPAPARSAERGRFATDVGS